VELRASVTSFAFDQAEFDLLRRKLGEGVLDPEASRLPEPPEPLAEPPVDLRPSAPEAAQVRKRLTAKGNEALAAGRAAVLVLNGGMATRFGGGAKGVVSVVPSRPKVSFLAIKLAEIAQRSAQLDAAIPVVLMHSFATETASESHLREIQWAGVTPSCRFSFSQSIMPRVLPDGTPLQSLQEAADRPDATLYAAPGHGDTLSRLRESGVLGQLVDRGVEHILVSNVDNVGASLDPFIFGAHLEAVEAGAATSVEVVRRESGDAGGCVARLPGSGMPAIIEGFRLPGGVDLTDYPHFNTNTLWLSTASLHRDIELTWFAVRKTIPWPERSGTDGIALPRAEKGKLDVIQFERLIGQITEFVPSAYLEVDRGTRFLPIKARENLTAAAPALEQFARRVGLI